MPTRFMSPTLLGLLVAALVAPAAAQNKCDAGKLKCVRSKLVCLIKVQEVSQKKGLPLDPTKLQKCMTKFDGGADPSIGCFAKLEAKADATCSTTGNAAAIEAQVDQYVDALVAALALTVSTTTATSPGVTTTTAPSLEAVCCEFASRCVGRNASAESCDGAGGTPGPAGSLCDASGKCVSPPGTAGGCCETLFSTQNTSCEMPSSSESCDLIDPGGIQTFFSGRECRSDGRCCLPRGAECSSGADCCSRSCRLFTLPPSCS